MSKFIDRLNQASQVAPPMGFRVTPAARSQPKLLLVASLAQASLSDVTDYVAGADAGLLPVAKSSSGAEAIKKVLQAVPDMPWGGWLKDIGQENITQITNAGCDFVVFPAASTALAIPQGNGVSKILEIAGSLSDGLLQAADKLPIDAVLIGSEQEKEQFLTWHHLMYFQHCADLLTKPLLAFIPSTVTAGELQALWAAGVDSVVVTVGDGQPAGRLTELRQAIDGLTLPLQRKRGKPAVSLPHLVDITAAVTEETEEEE